MAPEWLNTERFERLLGRAKKLQRYVPWVSLVFGVVGAAMMDRRPERVWLVVVAAMAGWALLVAVALLARVDATTLTGRRAMIVKGAQFGAVMAVQSVVQTSILFTLPFYARAAALTPWHIAFLAALAAVAALSLWDPWYEALVKHPLPSVVVAGFASFAGTNAVLPVLGLSNRVALLVACAVAALGAPVFAAATAAAHRRRRAITAAIGVVLLVAIAGPIGAARLVPPAPLELVRSAFGTSIEEHEVTGVAAAFEVSPQVLLCFTAIKAPLGLKDKLLHVWSRDGKVLDHIALDVQGGREAGFRTWSRKKSPGPGRWRCNVETASGQLLGGATVRIGP